MRNEFHSDNAAPCWHCRGTIVTYTVDDSVSLIDVLCVSCRRKDVFRPVGITSLECVADVSAAHRGAVS